MKWVELRRHSFRDDAGNLSPKGREVAERAAMTLAGPYQVYYSSSKPRAIQTIEAMGGHDVKVDDRFGLGWASKIAPFEPQAQAAMKEKGIGLLDAYLEIPEIQAILKETAQEVLEAVIDVASRLPEGGKALVGTHGGTIEPAVLLALGDFHLKAVGKPLAECEGVRFLVDRGTIVGVEVLRLAEYAPVAAGR